MLELAIVIAIVALLVHKLDSSKIVNAPGAPIPNGGQKTQVKQRVVLTIEGITKFSGRAEWLKAWGIQPKYVMDMGYFKPEADGPKTGLPAMIGQALKDSYEKGTAVGLEIMELVSGKRTLCADETLWFAIVDRAEPTLVALVAKNNPDRMAGKVAG